MIIYFNRSQELLLPHKPVRFHSLWCTEQPNARENNKNSPAFTKQQSPFFCRLLYKTYFICITITSGKCAWIITLLMRIVNWWVWMNMWVSREDYEREKESPPLDCLHSQTSVNAGLRGRIAEGPHIKRSFQLEILFTFCLRPNRKKAFSFSFEIGESAKKGLWNLRLV